MISASVTVYEVAPQLAGCDNTAYHKLARSDPDFGGGGSASVWVYLNQHEGDNTKCSSWGEDCCASTYWLANPNPNPNPNPSPSPSPNPNPNPNPDPNPNPNLTRWCWPRRWCERSPPRLEP